LPRTVDQPSAAVGGLGSLKRVPAANVGAKKGPTLRGERGRSYGKSSYANRGPAQDRSRHSFSIIVSALSPSIYHSIDASLVSMWSACPSAATVRALRLTRKRPAQIRRAGRVVRSMVICCFAAPYEGGSRCYLAWSRRRRYRAYPAAATSTGSPAPAMGPGAPLEWPYALPPPPPPPLPLPPFAARAGDAVRMQSAAAAMKAASHFRISDLPGVVVQPFEPTPGPDHSEGIAPNQYI